MISPQEKNVDGAAVLIPKNQEQNCAIDEISQHRQRFNQRL